jgi:hypothetical protein
MDAREEAHQRLRYLDASRVETPEGTLDDLALRGPSNERIGRLDGVIVDPLERRVRYFVVDSGAWLKTRRYLLPVGVAQVEHEHKILRVETDSDTLRQCEAFQSDAYPRFSDHDLVTALMSTHAA